MKTDMKAVRFVPRPSARPDGKLGVVRMVWERDYTAKSFVLIQNRYISESVPVSELKQNSGTV